MMHMAAQNSGLFGHNNPFGSVKRMATGQVKQADSGTGNVRSRHRRNGKRPSVNMFAAKPRAHRQLIMGFAGVAQRFPVAKASKA
jgi:hypothetical protein